MTPAYTLIEGKALDLAAAAAAADLARLAAA